MRIGTFTEYKGYTGSIEFSVEDGKYYGKLLNIDNTLANYSENTIEELYSEFKNTVNHYIEMKKMIAEADTNDHIVYQRILSTLKFNCKVIDMFITDTIKNENGEETTTVKYDSIKSFAEVMKAMNDTNLNFIKNTIGE